MLAMTNANLLYQKYLLLLNQVNGLVTHKLKIYLLMMMFAVDVVNVKVLDNFFILVFLKFIDFRPTVLGVMILKIP